MLQASSFVSTLLLINICCDAVELNQNGKQAIPFCIGSQILEGCLIVYLIAQVKAGEGEGSPWMTEVDGKCTEVGGLATSLLLLSH